MSIANLDSAIKSFGDGPWATKELRAIATALGETTKPKERARLAQLIDQTWQKWSDSSRRTLEVLAGHAAPDLKPTRFGFVDARETGIREQSALTFVSRELGFLVVGDEDAKVFQLPFDGSKRVRVREDDGAFHGLEGCTYDPETRSLLVVSENTRRLHEMPVREKDGALTLGLAKELARLPNISTGRNKGWEGVDVLPGKFSGDGKARLLSVHEASPRAIGIFNRRTGEHEFTVEVPEEIAALDLSDLAVDPETGRIFLLSHESAAVYEIELRRCDKMIGAGPPLPQWAIVPISSFELPAKHSAIQAEGLDFDDRGDLWITGEIGEVLLHFERE
jgi:uncharacterized protein YjiK